MMLTELAEIAAGIYHIDDRVCGISELGSVYLVAGDKKAIIDSGPAKSAPVVLSGIARAGYQPEDIDYIVVTHVHLDHAGGAANLLESMPRAKVVVHQRGARHMVNMERLIASAVAVQGKSVIERYGKSRSVPLDKIIEVGDGDVIDLGGGQSLEFIDAPGHAPHELCIRETLGGGIFVGDALGLLLGGGRALLPCHPPPSFNPETCIATTQRLQGYQPGCMYFAHFGKTEKAEEVLAQTITQLRELTDFTAAAYDSLPREELEQQLVKRLSAKLESLRDLTELYNYTRDSLILSGVNGFMSYFKKLKENRI
jgi:glyoxylase-like metal-dependent hydrolase (beta-lactamase superfamily II)